MDIYSTILWQLQEQSELSYLSQQLIQIDKSVNSYLVLTIELDVLHQLGVQLEIVSLYRKSIM